jgi:DNA-binding NtrC family response regulator
MTDILVVEADPGIRDLLTLVLEGELSAAVECARTGQEAAVAIETGLYDLAIIGVGTPQICGFDLAKYAADRHIPSLLCSGHPEALNKLKECEFPYLAKPFGLMELVHQSAKAIIHHNQNVSRVNASYARFRATAEALADAIGESDRLIAESRALLARALREPQGL